MRAPLAASTQRVSRARAWSLRSCDRQSGGRWELGGRWGHAGVRSPTAIGTWPKEVFFRARKRWEQPARTWSLNAPALACDSIAHGQDLTPKLVFAFCASALQHASRINVLESDIPGCGEDASIIHEQNTCHLIPSYAHVPLCSKSGSDAK